MGPLGGYAGDGAGLPAAKQTVGGTRSALGSGIDLRERLLSDARQKRGSLHTHNAPFAFNWADQALLFPIHRMKLIGVFQ
jgi:hypothetical protein